MKNQPLFWAVLILVFAACKQETADRDWTTPFEKSGGLESATVDEATAYYKALAEAYPAVAYRKWGLTDVGKPLSTVVVSRDGDFTPRKAREANKAVILVMNGIHPGESCGVDACMMLARELAQQKDHPLLEKAVLVIIPIYNIGGSLNRGCCTRANQVGPAEQGFRGNALNRDLNRDLSKADTRNTLAFQEIFQYWMPDLFVDTHTSNGADYPYTMTLITTQKDKLNPTLSKYVTETLEPELYRKMAGRGNEMIPYVYTMEGSPESGLRGFLETPRYTTGYTALFNTIGFVTEAHMFKTFRQRVEATYQFLETLLETTYQQRDTLRQAVEQAREETAGQKQFDINWDLDTTKHREIVFKGYTAVAGTSAVTGLPLTTYDRDRPYEQTVPFYDTYQTTDSIQVPYAYVIPQAYGHLTELLEWNGVETYTFTKDTVLRLQFDYIDHFNTLDFPWEGHYFHTEVQTHAEERDYQVYAGDALVIVNQPSNRYIVEMLEPKAVDSWFRWNYFDGILMQKEYFSPYVFEETALEMLEADTALAAEFQAFKDSIAPTHRSNYRLMDFLYKRSDYYEDMHNRYPIGKCFEKMTLPVASSE